VSARPDADPAPATPVAGAGSRRPGVVVLLVAAVLVTALVQGFVLQSYFVPTAALAPAVQPGDRVLVWKVRPSTGPGDLVVVDTTASGPVGRSTPATPGTVGRVLASLADFLDLDSGRQDRLAVVASGADRAGGGGDDVALGAPSGGTVSRDDVVGTVVLRVWPLDRFGTIPAVTP
jgi:hypothetical protein